jgi:acetyl esterase/lipase
MTAMPWVFLAVSVVGAWFTFNAFRPSSRWQILGVSFFAAWFTGELALWHIAWQAVATAVFIALGALDGWAGWLGLAITVASWIGLFLIGVLARRSAAIFDVALNDGIGLAAPGQRRRVRIRQVVFPLFLHDRRVERVKDIEYGPHGRRNRLDVYRQKRPTARQDGRLAPVLLQIHGGGWVIGDKGQQGLPLMLQLAAEGWVCVAPNYRLSPRATWPDHLVDCKRALAWVRAHIAEYGGDPDLVCVTGGSAGGHLAAMVGLTGGDPRYQPGFENADTTVAACVPFYGVYDLPDLFVPDGVSVRATRRLARWLIGKSPDEDLDAFRDASPVHQVREDAPPFFVIHGSADNLVPVRQARALVQELRATSHQPVLYAEVPGASHAFDVFHSTRTGNAVAAVGRFLGWVVANHRDQRSGSVPPAPDLVESATPGAASGSPAP